MNAYDAYVCWWCQSLLPVMVPLGPLFREDYYLIASGIGFNTDAALICPKLHLQMSKEFMADPKRSLMNLSNREQPTKKSWTPIFPKFSYIQSDL